VILFVLSWLQHGVRVIGLARSTNPALAATYPGQLHETAIDLADPQLLREGREALDVLSQLLNLGSVYPFQREGGGNG